MKLARFLREGGAHLGLVRDNMVVDLTAGGFPFRRMLDVIEAGGRSCSAASIWLVTDWPHGVRARPIPCDGSS